VLTAEHEYINGDAQEEYAEYQSSTDLLHFDAEQVTPVKVRRLCVTKHMCLDNARQIILC
jgi:hypothetical protein